MKKTTTSHNSKVQLNLNFKESSKSPDNRNTPQRLEAKIVKLDPNHDLYKKILNRKSY
jgi:hypothetical protein